MRYLQCAVREWAWLVGAGYPEREWLVCDYDTWEPNPHYLGPPG